MDIVAPVRLLVVLLLAAGTVAAEEVTDLRDAHDHFPLQHFWGPLANIKSTAWIVNCAIVAARRFQPRFNFLYLPHLDYAAQKTGPDSEPALAALAAIAAGLAWFVGHLIARVALRNQPPTRCPTLRRLFLETF